MHSGNNHNIYKEVDGFLNLGEDETTQVRTVEDKPQPQPSTDSVVVPPVELPIKIEARNKLETRIKYLEEFNGQLTSAVEDLESEAEELKESNKKFTQENVKLKDEIANLNTQYARLLEQVKILENEKQKLAKNNTELQFAIIQHEKKFQDAKRKNDAYEYYSDWTVRQLSGVINILNYNPILNPVGLSLSSPFQPREIPATSNSNSVSDTSTSTAQAGVTSVTIQANDNSSHKLDEESNAKNKSERKRKLPPKSNTAKQTAEPRPKRILREASKITFQYSGKANATAKPSGQITTNHSKKDKNIKRR